MVGESPVVSSPHRFGYSTPYDDVLTIHCGRSLQAESMPSVNDEMDSGIKVKEDGTGSAR